MTFVRHLYACFVMLLITAPGAGAQTFTPLGPLGGEFGRVFVAPSQPATLFTFPGSDIGGLFKSTDSGNTWVSVSAAMSAGSCDIHVNDVAIDPTQPNTVYAATLALGVCKSTDGGATWAQAISGLPNDANSFQLPVNVIAVNPQTPTVLYAGTKGGIYISSNSGSTWTLSGASGREVTAIAFAPSAANTAYASVDSGLLKTTNGGGSWPPMETGLASPVATGQLAVHPTNPNIAFLISDNVYKTSNGTSWAPSNTGVGIGTVVFLGNIIFDPTSPSTMFMTAIGGCGLCKSIDTGANWTAVVTTGLPTGFGIPDLAETAVIDPLTPSRMFAGTPTGVFRSTNNGVAWSSVSTGLNGKTIGALALGSDIPASVYVATTSKDDGADISKLTGGVLPFSPIVSPLTAIDSGKLTDLVVDPNNANFMYAVGGKSGNQNCGQVYKTINGGTSWNLMNPPNVPGTLCAQGLVMDPVTPSTLYVGVFKPTGGAQSASIYKTITGANSWTNASTGLSFGISRIAISKLTPALLFATGGGQVFKSTNGGGNWSPASSGLPGGGSGFGNLVIDPTNDNIVYLGTSQGVFGTINGGTSWTAKRGGAWPSIHGGFCGAGGLAIDPTTPTTLYAGAQTPGNGPVGFLGARALGTGLYKSTDSGATWTSAGAALAGVQVQDVRIDGNRAIFASTNNGLFRLGLGTTAPTMTLDKTALTFGAVSTGTSFSAKTGTQTVRLTQTGAGTVTWTASSATPWLVVSPASGSGSATLSLSVQFASALAATQSGNVTLTFTGASNTAGPVVVTLNILTTTAAAAPSGSFDTPGDGATGVVGSIPVTGWALDDTGVTRVRIMRDPVAGEPAGALVFLGDAVLVEGARPDVQAMFPNLPFASRAGFGYLMLTNFLPGLGNGTFKLTAIADDAEGHSTVLGSKTITCANSSAVTPFGGIDTPLQGETITTASLNNFGWVLSPGSRKANPPDGGAVQVVIDGVLGVAPGQWTARADLTALFSVSSFSGIAHALGVATLDTTALANGVHTISWLVTDNLGSASGIGSRYFTVSNGAGLTVDASSFRLKAETTGSVEGGGSVQGRRGYDAEAPMQSFEVRDGRATIQSEELDRVELHLGAGARGYQVVAGALQPLPIGSHLDPDTGIFTWQPGVAFLGSFDLAFAGPGGRRDVRVVLNPKGSGRVGPQTVIDIADGRIVAGWAADLDAQVDAGVDTVHVWAYPADGSNPIFVGAAEYGGARPDVAGIYGERFTKTGYGISIQGRLAPGTYDLAVFAYSTVRGRFVPAKVTRVTIR